MTDINSRLAEEYLASFNEQQHHVMSVAIEKLGSSFNVAKSNGFLKWKTKRSQQLTTPAPPTSAPPTSASPTSSLTTPTPTIDVPMTTPSAPQKKKLVLAKDTKSAIKTQEPPKKKRLIVKRKTPTTVITTNEEKESQTAIYVKLSDILKQHSLEVPEPTQLRSPLATKAVITHETGSVYCIFSDTELLYVGTTSDTKKNFSLAYKSTLKTLQSSKTPDTDVSTSTTPTLYGIIVPTEDNKQRIRVRDVIKKTLLSS